MEKKRLEQIILFVLIPLFLIGLLYMRSKAGGLPKSSPAMPALEEMFMEDESVDKIPEPSGIPDIRYEGGGRDPLKDFLKEYLDKLEEKGAGEPGKVIPLPELNIEGLIWNTDLPQAIINGQVIRIGETIEGVEIVKIGKDGVTVRHQGQQVLVPKK